MRGTMSRLPQLQMILLVSALLVLFNGCNGGGGGGGSSGGGSTASGSTTVSGSVSLSSSVMTPSLRKASNKNAASFAAGSALADATVELFNADHPEWLYPVAVALTGASGSYTLNVLSHATDNGGAYTDGNAIPSGNYTVMAHKYDGNTAKLYVGVQAYVKNFDGAVTGNDLEALDRGAVPGVLSMFGLSKNADETFGGDANELPKNAAIQVTFNTPMARLSVLRAIGIINPSNTTVNGSWKISADLLNATFYPTAGSLAVGTVYTVTVLGGTNVNAAVNLYNTPIPADVIGKFLAAAEDTTPPNSVYCGSQTTVPISTPILIASNELLDINTFSISSTPSIGAKPTVIFKGQVTGCGSYTFGYEIVPSGLLQLDTNYSITVSGTKDIAGLSLTALTFNFKTEASHTPVSIVSTDPIANATNVSLNKNISVTFSGAINPLSVTPTTFTLSDGSSNIAGTASGNGTIATFITSTALIANKSYTATVTNGITDLSGMAIQAGISWTFTTQAAGSTTSKWDTAKWDTDKWGN